MPKCKDAISNLTEQQSEHVELNPLISDQCEEVLKKHCEVTTKISLKKNLLLKPLKCSKS